MKPIKHKPTLKDWIYGIGLSLLLIVFLIWIRSPWGLIALPFVFDAYITRRVNWSWWKELENPLTRLVMSWVDAIVFALVAVYFVNLYFFQNYTIPSSSLEKSLLVGDYLFVSKTSYGPRAPMTPLSLPLVQHTLPFGGIQSYLTWPQWKYKRVSPKRVTLNDIVVFNYPAGDTIVSAPMYQAQDYYLLTSILGRQIYQGNFGSPAIPDSLSGLALRQQQERVQELGRQYIRQNTQEFGRIASRPVDRRENYVKRCVGLPGQTLEIRDRIIYLDGKANKEPDEVQYNYEVELLERMLPSDLVREIGLSNDDLMMLYQQGICPLTQAMKQTLEARTDLVKSIRLLPQDEGTPLYPVNGNTGWTCDNYGPLWIPAKGESITLTLDNLPLYERPIRNYEGNTLEVTPEGKIRINGEETNTYTFRMDYYWMMGDNRHNSADSRFWGFVPEDHVVGKPILIWLSLNKDYGLFNGGIRWNRLFRWVDHIK